MYYARQPENAFCEEWSMELGFFDGSYYEKVINLGEQGFDATLYGSVTCFVTLALSLLSVFIPF